MRFIRLATALVLFVAFGGAAFATCTPPAIAVTPSNPTCGSPATLDAGSGWSTYHWTDAYGYDYGSARTMTTAFSGTYTVEVSDGNGCTTTASATVAVEDFALARVPSAACPDQLIRNVEIVGTAGTYSWTLTNGTIVNDYGRNIDLTIDGTATAVLTATVDDGAGCVMSKSAAIAVADPLGEATIAAGDTTLCQGASTSITATPAGGSGSYSYVWHAYGDTVNATTATIVVSPSGTAWYYAEVLDNYGCGSTTTPAVQVEVTPISAAITAPDNACVNVTSTASAPQGANGTTYAWTIDGGGAIEWGQGTTAIGFHPGPGGSTIGLTVTSGECTATGSKFVGGLPQPAQPTISPSGPTTFCSGSSVTLTSSPANTYLWSNGATTQSILVSASGSYSVTVTNAAGCSSVPSAPAGVTVNNRPFAAVSGGGTICAGGSASLSVSLSGTAPFTLTWSDGFTQTVSSGTTATRTVSPSVSTNYTLTAVSDATGCPGITGGNAYVLVRTPPTATVSGSTAVCAGASATISASLTLTDYPVNVTWSDGFTQQLSSGTTATRSVSPNDTTIYTVTAVSDSFCSGTSSGSATVTIDRAPTITVQPASVTIRKNTTAMLSVSASSPRPMTYQWYLGSSGNTTSPIPGATSSSYTTPKLQSTTSYWVRVTNSCGATNSATATVTVR